jgi:hypothetical protein
MCVRDLLSEHVGSDYFEVTWLLQCKLSWHHTFAYTCTHMYICIHTYVHTCKRVYVCMYVRACVYVCVCVCVLIEPRPSWLEQLIDL